MFLPFPLRLLKTKILGTIVSMGTEGLILPFQVVRASFYQSAGLTEIIVKQACGSFQPAESVLASICNPHSLNHRFFFFFSYLVEFGTRFLFFWLDFPHYGFR